MGYVARRSKRFLPKDSVTVALLTKDHPVAYGVVTDISEAGACVVTDTPLATNRPVTLQMSFHGTGMLAAGGRVVWSEATQPARRVQGARHGVEFTKLSTAERRQLQRILDSATLGLAAD
jgi:hypothetical protein